MSAKNFPGLRRGIVAAGLATASMLSIPAAACGQANSRVVGFKLGLATSNSSLDSDGERFEGETVTGLTAGVFGRLPLGERMAVQAELLYVRKGSSDLAGLDARSTILQFPLTIQYLIPVGDVGVRPYAGPVIDYSLSCDPKEIKVRLFPDEPPIDYALADCPFGANTVRGGVLGGVLFEFALGRTILALDARYDLGIGHLAGGRLGLPGIDFPDADGYRGFEITIGLGVPVRSSRRR